MINMNLAEKQNLNNDEIVKIKLLHEERDILFLKTERTTDTKLINYLYKEWLKLKNELEKTWKFSEDIHYVRTWMFPNCSCNKDENENAYPSGHIFVNKKCKIHGEEQKNWKKKKTIKEKRKN